MPDLTLKPALEAFLTPTLAAIALTLAVTLCYCLACAVAPFGRCFRCGGRRGRACPACDGTGRRTRFGRRLYHWARREYGRSGHGRSHDDYRH